MVLLVSRILTSPVGLDFHNSEKSLRTLRTDLLLFTVWFDK